MGFFGSLFDLFGRILIASLFLINGISKIFNYEISSQYMDNYGVPELLLIPAIVIEILFPLLLIIGYKIKISSFILSLFTLTVAIIFHSDFSNQAQLISFLKNVAIIGGLFLLISNKPGRYSFDK